ncbi:hypothetical protein UPYG_G00131410 [Umbra pygmaea]|uniref:Uncharacterized protein n=1 Tax=Umbra pygmaea TaxID=75934 RepID=A0ABD0WXU5_UMBPY
MSKLKSFRALLKERLTTAAMESFEAVEKTVEEDQEEDDRLRRLLQLTPEIQLSRIAPELEGRVLALFQIEEDEELLDIFVAQATSKIKDNDVTCPWLSTSLHGEPVMEKRLSVP